MDEQLTEKSGTGNDSTEKSFLGIIVHSFFVIPFLITVFAVLLFTAARIVTHERHSVYDYLNDVRTGSLNKRWQAAFELSKILATPKLVPQDDRFTREMVNAFEGARQDDVRVRQYLALAMGRTGNVDFADPLVDALKTEESDTAYAIIYALGTLGYVRLAPAIYPFLDSPDARIRLAAVMALGNLNDTDAIELIKKALQDPEPNVTWDAAIALAKMKDMSGKEILLKLLDRNYLAGFTEVDSQEQMHILLVALNASRYLQDPQLTGAIEKLASRDPNMSVRRAALEAIKTP